LGNKKYLVVEKRKLEGEWGSGGLRRGEGRLSCKKQALGLLRHDTVLLGGWLSMLCTNMEHSSKVQRANKTVQHREYRENV